MFRKIGLPPQIIHLNRVFHYNYNVSILIHFGVSHGIPIFDKHPYDFYDSKSLSEMLMQEDSALSRSAFCSKTLVQRPFLWSDQKPYFKYELQVWQMGTSTLHLLLKGADLMLILKDAWIRLFACKDLFW